ncbi:ArsR family transcriptional regulator [Caballeronia sp. NCTM1]|uniref:ArsR family transcriptional regulator n=1 Tax=Caballeronia sp. NCTM1 TaxID=2921753 RepID=UPI002027A223|nr:ArsR family transcriptional regulator [Caballeronia sp. NCTM1]
MKGSPKDPNSVRYRNRRLIVELLQKEPATVPEIAAIMGMSISAVRQHIVKLHTATPKQVYICGWRQRVGGRGGDGAAAIYRTGNKRDVALDTKLSKRVAAARYRDKMHALLLAKAAIKRGTFNPFWQLAAGQSEASR